MVSFLVNLFRYLLNNEWSGSLTFAATRVLYGEVQSMETHFLFKQTLIVVCCTIWWTDGVVVRWAFVRAHTAGIMRSKSLTQTVIMTSHVKAWIQVWKKSTQLINSQKRWKQLNLDNTYLCVRINSFFGLQQWMKYLNTYNYKFSN